MQTHLYSIITSFVRTIGYGEYVEKSDSRLKFEEKFWRILIKNLSVSVSGNSVYENHFPCRGMHKTKEKFWKLPIFVTEALFHSIRPVAMVYSKTLFL